MMFGQCEWPLHHVRSRRYGGNSSPMWRERLRADRSSCGCRVGVYLVKDGDQVEWSFLALCFVRAGLQRMRATSAL